MPSTAKLFNNGRSQAVRIPKDYAFEGIDDSFITFFVSNDIFPSRQTNRDSVIALRNRKAEIFRFTKRIGKRVAIAHKADFRSSIKSLTFSIPTENRTSESVIPTLSRTSLGTLACVIDAG